MTKIKLLSHNNNMSPKETASKIIPAKKVVVIELVELESASKIEYVQEKKQETGKVVVVGKGKLPVEMKAGDTVVFRKFGEDKILLDGKEYLFVTFPDILRIIK